MAIPITKQSGEVRPLYVNFKNQLPPGTTIESLSVTAADFDGNDLTATLIQDNSEDIDGERVGVVLEGGTSGMRAKLNYEITLSDASVLIDTVVLIIQDY
jgi:hypothetical protein